MQDRIQIKTQKERFAVAPELYGLFFEDINRAADGGLYPEMIRNRAFEDSLVPEGCTTDKNKIIYLTEYGWPGAFHHGEGMDEWAAAVPYTEIPGWYAQDAEMELLLQDTLHVNRKAALSVHFKKGGRISNIGFCGIPAVRGDNYLVTVFLKAAENCCITVCLENEKGEELGKTELAVQKGKDYVKYEGRLTAKKTDYRAKVSFSCEETCTVILGFTSLMPEKTFCGHGMREDLALALKNTHAKFIRFPGGCVVEGINEENALRFSRTVGPIWERPSTQTMWHYRTTNGLGFHEYLQLCEDLDMQALYVCNCGMSCQARHGKGFDRDMTREYLDEALHALEYALGGEETEYGSKRAAAGHPRPFALKYVEIGNENFGPEYMERYRLFYETLKTAYPDVIYIANVHTEAEGLPTEMVDEHYYNAPEFFLNSGDMYEDYDRNGPAIFAGEYAVNGGHTIASMECALAEAVYLANVERNQDIVRLTSYAPLFQNADYTAWKPNLIVFNNHQVYGIPTYHVLSMMAKERGETVVEIENSCEKHPPIYRGIPGIMCEKEGLLFRNVKINGKPAAVSKNIYGETKEENGEYHMILGTQKHHYTGKSPEWNQAFEEFINSGDLQEKPVIWAAFSEENLEEYTFELEAKFEEDNAVTFSIWNDCPKTDAGCNEPRDTQWTLRSVRNQVWRIENGKSANRVPRMFEKPLMDSELVSGKIDYSKYNHYKIVCDHYGFSCYINGKLIQEKKHTLYPVVTACAATDKDMVILKMVHVAEEEREIRIMLDCDIADEMEATVLQAAPETVNSFERPEQAAPVTTAVFGGSREFLYRVPGNSLTILKMKKI